MDLATLINDLKEVKKSMIHLKKRDEEKQIEYRRARVGHYKVTESSSTLFHAIKGIEGILEDLKEVEDELDKFDHYPKRVNQLEKEVAEFKKTFERVKAEQS